MLIVDDSAVMRAFTAGCLTEIGVTVCDQAGDGYDAVRMVGGKQLRCVFLDLTRELNGLETLKAIRASGNRVPVVVVTSDTSKSLLVRGMLAGASDFIQKPFDKEGLLRKARRAMADEWRETP